MRVKTRISSHGFSGRRRRRGRNLKEGVMRFRNALLVSSLACAAAVAYAANAQSRTDWPSYNRMLTSERFSPLTSIDAAAGKLKVSCTYDTGETTAFQSGLIVVNGALLATTEFGDY
jgi:alcohol dehydrogenase (cytochrome c)